MISIPAAHLARHRYRYALFNGDSDLAGEVFLPDDHEEEGKSWVMPLASTGLRVQAFIELSPDETPKRRWIYDFQGNPLYTEVWKQDFDRTWNWMNQEWIAEYSYDDRGRLVRESFYDSIEVYGELWVHHYNEAGLRFLSERWNEEKTKLRSVEMVERFSEGGLDGWRILGPKVEWNILYDNGPYEIRCFPENPYAQRTQGCNGTLDCAIHTITIDERKLPLKRTRQNFRNSRQASGGATMTAVDSPQVLALYRTVLFS